MSAYITNFYEQHQTIIIYLPSTLWLSCKRKLTTVAEDRPVQLTHFEFSRSKCLRLLTHFEFSRSNVCVYHELLWATPNNYYIFAIHSMAFLQTKADNSRWGPPSTAYTLWVFAIELQRFATKFCEVFKGEMRVFKPAHASFGFFWRC